MYSLRITPLAWEMELICGCVNPYMATALGIDVVVPRSSHYLEMDPGLWPVT